MSISFLKINHLNKYSPVFFFLLLSFLVFNYPEGYYILTLDMTFPLKKFFTDFFYGFSDPVWGGTVPLGITLELYRIIPAWFIQRTYLFSIIFFSGISMYSLIKTKSSIPRYFGGILYAINPFTYVRFLAGHWFILLAYSIMPFAVKSFLDFLVTPDKKNLVQCLFLTACVGAINSHILTLLLLVYFIIFIINLYQLKNKEKKAEKILKSTSVLSLLFILLSFYWLLPFFTAKATLIHQLSGADMYAFATKTSAFNTVFTIASMHGFWRSGYIYAKDFIPYWYLLFFFLLFLAVHGFINYYKNKNFDVVVKSFGLIAILSVILGSGIHGPFSSLFEYLFNNIFIFRGLRDSQKFAALIVLSYSYLGALGIAEFEKIGRLNYSPEHINAKKFLAWLIVFLAIITPFAYSFTMFNNFWGQLKPVDYPDDWYYVNDFLSNDTQDFNVLFLPWHAYMDLKWIPNSKKRIGNPAYQFFNKPIIQGENTEIGTIYSQSTNPAQRYVESHLNNRNNITNFGEKMVLLNVKYIFLTKEVDYKEYIFLFNQTDLELIEETENFYIFLNKHPISRFYYSPGLPTSSQKQHEYISSLKPIGFKQSSSVKFFTNKTNGYIVFVPPNLDSDYWELNGNPSTVNDFIAIFPAKQGQIYYKRFDTYLVGYIVSLTTLIGIIIWYKKESMENILRKIKHKQIGD